MSAPSPRAPWSARRRSRSCWPRRSWRSSAATPSRRRAAISTRSWPGCSDRPTRNGGPLVIVYLVGMPGSGKSTVGPELARRLGVPFVELDERIEDAAGSSVREIFERDGEARFRGVGGSEGAAGPSAREICERDGEARFRELEATALVEAASRDPSVVSCGGGGVLEPASRVSLRATGEVVFLSVPLEVLAERVRPGADRPLIRSAGDLERLFRDREPLYREFAAHVVDASGSVQDVAAAIEKELLRWSA